MGIVAYFARVSSDQLEALKNEPEKFWSLSGSPDFRGAQLTDLDRDWEILSWFLSAKKRQEQKHQTITMAVMRREDAQALMDDDAAWAAAMKEEQRRLDVELVDPENLPSDPLLIAIEGRGTEVQRIQELNFGLGAARLFLADEVRELAQEFMKVDGKDLERNFEPETMEKLDVGGIRWLSEPASVLAEFILPRLNCIKAFYKDAADANQCVLVAYA